MDGRAVVSRRSLRRPGGDEPEYAAGIPGRGPLYFGPDFSLDGLKARYLECLANVRAQFGWVDERLRARDFMLGAAPGLPDALVYYLVWFLRDRMGSGDEFLSQFENLIAWEQRVKNIGHGAPQDMSDLAALDIARAATPQTPQQSDPGDPTKLTVGENVAVEPVTGGPQVTGMLHAVSADHVAVMRQDDQVGEVCVNFPRIGYRVLKA